MKGVRGSRVPSPGWHKELGLGKDWCPAPLSAPTQEPPNDHQTHPSAANMHFLFTLHFMQSQPHISLCSLFPSTVSYPILNYSSNRVLALPPGDPLCSHRACCTQDKILLMSSPTFLSS